MCGIGAYLTVVPIMRVSGRAQNACRHGRGNFFFAAGQEKRIGYSAALFGVFNQQLNHVFFRSGDNESQAIEQAAGADAQRFRGNGIESYVLDKFGGRSSGFQARR
jgi:hypothetical protein